MLKNQKVVLRVFFFVCLIYLVANGAIAQEGAGFKNSTGDTVLFVGENKNVGIGTSQPTSYLHVRANNSTDDGITVENTGTGFPMLRFRDSDFYEVAKIYWDDADNKLIWDVSDSLIFNAFGEIGLAGEYNTGVNASGYKLHIYNYDNDDTDYTYPIYVEDENGSVDFWLRSKGSQSGTSIAYFQGNVGIGTEDPDRPLTIQGTGTYNQLISFKDNTGTTQWHLNYYNTGLNFAESTTADFRLFLEDGGNVGVGTNNPSNPLTVEGNADFTANVGIGTASPTGKLHLSDLGDILLILDADTNNSGETDNPRIELRQDGNYVIGGLGYEGEDGQTFTNSLSNALYLVNDYNSTLQLGTNNTARLTITGDGKVGINTIDDIPSTLTVNGGVTIESAMLTRGYVWFRNTGGEYNFENIAHSDRGNMQYEPSNGRLFYDSSSRKHKRNITPLQDDFYKILNAQPKTYTRPEFPGRWEIGYIAEEFDELGLNNLVYYRKAGKNPEGELANPDDGIDVGDPQGVNYRKISIYLVEIVRDQQEKLEEFDREIEQLKKDIQALKDNR